MALETEPGDQVGEQKAESLKEASGKATRGVKCEGPGEAGIGRTVRGRRLGGHYPQASLLLLNGSGGVSVVIGLCSGLGPEEHEKQTVPGRVGE